MSYDGLQFDHYQLLHAIGRSDKSKIYLAEDTRSQRQVTIEILQIHASSDASEEATRLFQHEMKALDMLDHPHILPLFDFGDESIDGTTFTYLVMPFRKEGSLATWLQQRDSSEALPLEDIEHFLYQAANALQHAHDQGLIHQDVEPSNFLIRNRKEHPNRPDLLLTGFRINTLAAPTAGTTETICGTPAYIAPEQWSDQPVPASDQYALAVMVYQLLTGRPLFQGTLEEVKHQHLNFKPQLPSILNPGIPAALDMVILQALAKKPEDRFPSILAFAEAFQQALLPELDSKDATRPSRPFDKTQAVSLANISTFLPPPPPIDTRLHLDPLVHAKGRGNARRTLVLLIGLILVLAGGNIVLLYSTITNQTARGIITHAHAKANTTAQASVTNTAGLLAYPPNDRLKLNDPLIDNSKGYKWEEHIQNNGSCAFQGGAYHVSRLQQEGFYTCIALKSNFSNFTYEVQMTIIKGDCGGIVFRVQEPKFYYYRICADGSYALTRYVQDVLSSQTCVPGSAISTSTSPQMNKILTCGTVPAIHIGLNVPILISVAAYSNNIDLYINRQFITTVYDSSFTQGQIGLLAKSELIPTEVVFTNAKVWE